MCTVISIAQFAQLVAHYKLNEADGVVAGDSSGNGFDGTISGTATWIEGEIDGALELAGDGNITLPASSMELSIVEGSISLWMNADVPTSIYTLFSAGDNTTGGGFGDENEMHLHIEEANEYWSGGELSFFVIGNSANTFIFSDPDKGTDPAVAPVDPTLVTDNEWHHIVATWGNNMCQMYIDNEVITSAAYDASDYELSNVFLGSMLGGGRAYIGKLDDVRIFDGVLNILQIDSLFNKLEPAPPEPEAINENQINKFELTAFPNPASEQVTIGFRASKIVNATATIYNITGNEIATLNKQTVLGNNFFFHDVTNYSSGVYFVKLQIEEQTEFIKFIIK